MIKIILSISIIVICFSCSKNPVKTETIIIEKNINLFFGDTCRLVVKRHHIQTAAGYFVAGAYDVWSEYKKFVSNPSDTDTSGTLIMDTVYIPRDEYFTLNYKTKTRTNADTIYTLTKYASKIESVTLAYIAHF